MISKVSPSSLFVSQALAMSSACLGPNWWASPGEGETNKHSFTDLLKPERHVKHHLLFCCHQWRLVVYLAGGCGQQIMQPQPPIQSSDEPRTDPQAALPSGRQLRPLSASLPAATTSPPSFSLPSWSNRIVGRFGQSGNGPQDSLPDWQGGDSV